MAIKFVSENSNISVTTFVEAPETADLDIQIKDNTIISAETMFKITSIESIYSQLGIPADIITNEQLITLVDKVIELQESGDKVNESSLLDWASRSAIFATLASVDPLVATVSAIVAFASYGTDNFKKIRSLLD
jgi:hypothetical protein